MTNTIDRHRDRRGQGPPQALYATKIDRPETGLGQVVIRAKASSVHLPDGPVAFGFLPECHPIAAS
jgi:NADPH:quinone reductase-like Zn-dependent oxidoreductase